MKLAEFEGVRPQDPLCPRVRPPFAAGEWGGGTNFETHRKRGVKKFTSPAARSEAPNIFFACGAKKLHKEANAMDAD